MAVYDSEWRLDSGIGDRTAALHEHRINTGVLGLARQADQLNIPNFACFEQLVRRQIQIEMAAERNAKHPDYGGLDLATGGPTTEDGAAASKGFREWVHKRQGERAQTLKQARLLREERHNEDQLAKGGKGADDPDPKKKPRPKPGAGAGDDQSGGEG